MVDGLSRMAQDQASAFRIPAIQRLGTLGLAASNAVPGLLPMVNDPNPMTRHMAMRALGEIKARPELVVPALTNLLSNPDPGTRMAATLALRAFGYTAPFQPGMPERSLMPGQPYLPERTNRLGPGDRSKTPAPHINSP
jgi:HEAT repeat protein